jgi:hypothetical protein
MTTQAIQATPAPAADVARLLADPSLFQRWLEEQVPHRVVGKCQEPGRCPIHNYLQDNSANHYAGNIEVTKYTVEFAGIDNDPVMLPRWAKDFIYALDQWGNVIVTAAFCLDVLGEVESRLAEDGGGVAA